MSIYTLLRCFEVSEKHELLWLSVYVQCVRCVVSCVVRLPPWRDARCLRLATSLTPSAPPASMAKRYVDKQQQHNGGLFSGSLTVQQHVSENIVTPWYICVRGNRRQHLTGLIRFLQEAVVSRWSLSPSGTFCANFCFSEMFSAEFNSVLLFQPVQRLRLFLDLRWLVLIDVLWCPTARGAHPVSHSAAPAPGQDGRHSPANVSASAAAPRTQRVPHHLVQALQQPSARLRPLSCVLPQTSLSPGLL